MCLIGYNSTPEEDMHRVMILRDYGCDPYVMPYDKTDPYQLRFTRWVNNKAIFFVFPGTNIIVLSRTNRKAILGRWSWYGLKHPAP